VTAFASGYAIGGVGVDLEEAACCFCLETAATLLFDGTDRLHGFPGRFRVVACRRCGLMRTTPRPTRESIGLYYPGDYAPYAQTAVDEVEASRRIGRSIADPLDVATPDVPPGRMLEIGAASGSFLRHMQQAGWDVTGIEPDAASAGRAAERTGAVVHRCTIEDVDLEEAEFDLICAWMTLEHVHDPVAGLRLCWRWLKPGGWLAFSVPDCGTWQFWTFRGQWFTLQLPTHLHHFTAPMLRRILAAGEYTEVAVLRQRTMIDVPLSVAYVAEHVAPVLGTMPRRLASTLPVRAASRVIGIVAAPLRLTGRLTVWARKPLAATNGPSPPLP
jgi:SAM-dependent methyltransferase